jgi:hypothetical protein
MTSRSTLHNIGLANRWGLTLEQSTAVILLYCGSKQFLKIDIAKPIFVQVLNLFSTFFGNTVYQTKTKQDPL